MFLFRFRNECPDGKLTKQHLKTLFEKVFPDGEKTFDSKLIFEKLNHAKCSPLTFSHQEMPQKSRLRFSASLILTATASSILKSSLWQLMWPIEQQVDLELLFQRIFNQSCKMSINSKDKILKPAF